MYLGRIVEYGSVRQVIKNPQHPYTKGLLASLPSMSTNVRRLPSIYGSVPMLTDIPPGCAFHPRCPFGKDGVCNVGGPPALEDIDDAAGPRQVACARHQEIGE